MLNFALEFPTPGVEVTWKPYKTDIAGWKMDLKEDVFTIENRDIPWKRWIYQRVTLYGCVFSCDGVHVKMPCSLSNLPLIIGYISLGRQS